MKKILATLIMMVGIQGTAWGMITANELLKNITDANVSSQNATTFAPIVQAITKNLNTIKTNDLNDYQIKQLNEQLITLKEKVKKTYKSKAPTLKNLNEAIDKFTAATKINPEIAKLKLEIVELSSSVKILQTKLNTLNTKLVALKDKLPTATI